MKKSKFNSMFKDLERRYKPRFLENFHFNKCLNAISYLVFALVFVVLIKAIISQFIPPKPSPPIIVEGSAFLFSYNGLPLLFWFLLGIGLALGLAFHGFKLFSINIEKNINDEKKK